MMFSYHESTFEGFPCIKKRYKHARQLFGIQRYLVSECLIFNTGTVLMKWIGRKRHGVVHYFLLCCFVAVASYYENHSEHFGEGCYDKLILSNIFSEFRI